MTLQALNQWTGPSKAVRLGVIGAGNFATATSLPILDKVREVQKVGLASAGGLSGAHAGRRHGFDYTTTDEAEILADADINTVAILTRHKQHARQTVAALTAEKHVLCEKPPALNEAELAEVWGALQSSGTVYTVGYNRRFSPFGLALKGHFDPVKEPLLCTYRVNAGKLPLDHWVQDPEQGGRLLGEVCHFVDFLIFMTDSHPVEVSALALPDGGRYRQDNLVLSLRFGDGSAASVVYGASGDRGMGKERVEILGGGRSGILDDFRKVCVVSGRPFAQPAQLAQAGQGPLGSMEGVCEGHHKWFITAYSLCRYPGRVDDHLCRA